MPSKYHLCGSGTHTVYRLSGAAEQRQRAAALPAACVYVPLSCTYTETTSTDRSLMSSAHSSGSQHDSSAIISARPCSACRSSAISCKHARGIGCSTISSCLSHCTRQRNTVSQYRADTGVRLMQPNGCWGICGLTHHTLFGWRGSSRVPRRLSPTLRSHLRAWSAWARSPPARPRTVRYRALGSPRP